MKKAILFLMSLSTLSSFAQQPPYLLVGTYTGGKSNGIYVYRFHTDGTSQLIDSVISADPSYLAVAPRKDFVYAVNEVGTKEGGGKVTAYRFNNKTGKLKPINQVSSEGEHPCYISIDKSGKWVIVGNYSSGNAAVLPVLSNGTLGKAVSTVNHSGRGSTPRQQNPHVHATVLSPDNRYLLVPDLGIDKLMVYAFNASNGQLTLQDSSLKMPDGAGPRHFDWHPSGKWGYLLQELSGEVTLFRYRDGQLSPSQTLSVIPTTFSGSFTSADIHVSPDGQFLYTSTRDDSNTLALFRIDPQTGVLTLIGHFPTMGKTPRNFSIDPSGRYLLTANQNSDQIVVFAIDKETGSLKDTGLRIDVGNPVCLKWVE